MITPRARESGALIAFGEIDPTHLSDNVFAALLQYSPSLPADLLRKRSLEALRGSSSATYLDCKRESPEAKKR